jgi:hypothetical protein
VPPSGGLSAALIGARKPSTMEGAKDYSGWSCASLTPTLDSTLSPSSPPIVLTTWARLE